MKPVYTAEIKLKAEDIDRINKLFDIEYFDALTDSEMIALGANTDWHESVYEAEFTNGARITYDFCSGQSNYYDNVVFYDPDGFDYVLDCDFELGNIEVEFDAVYRVKIVRV